jgi:hypothetical protein
MAKPKFLILPENGVIPLGEVNFDTLSADSINHLGRRVLGDDAHAILADPVLQAMKPQGKQKVTLNIFHPNKTQSCKEVDKGIKKRGTSAFWQLLALYTLYPEGIQDTKGNELIIATQWQDKQGHWCCAIWFRWYGDRGVNVRRNYGAWNYYYRFASAARQSSVI